MKSLDKNQIETIVDIIIPPGKNGEPSGSQSRAADYIQTALQDLNMRSELYEYVQKLSNLSGLNVSIMKKEEKRNPALFSSMVELIYEAYYGDPIIVEKLELPRPPQPRGHEMKPFDISLLQTVIERSNRE